MRIERRMVILFFLIWQRPNEDTWEVVGDFKLQGANGVPKLTFDPPLVSFGKCSLTRSVETEVVLKNEVRAYLIINVLGQCFS